MKNLSKLFVLLIALFLSCKKEEKKEPVAELPTVSTSAITDITYNSAVCAGDANADDFAAIIEKGVCWSTTPGPELPSAYTNPGPQSGNGPFTVTMTTEIKPGTTYYVRAYARNRVGTAYGAELNFTTVNPTAPTITTDAATDITDSSATAGGNIVSDGGAPVSSRGICWNTTGNPTTGNSSIASGSGKGVFTGAIKNLTSNTKYYVRAYATNNSGIASYGPEVSFTTSPGIGDNFQGGKIAYILKPGDAGYNATVRHGIIASLSDQSASTPWAITLTSVGGTSQNLGTGQANTSAIIANQGAGSYAAKICDDLVEGGFSDWYLPSLSELTKMYLNKTKIGGFVVAFYWSSSEETTNAAWQQSFNSNSQAPGTKISTASVRAVRSF